MSERYALRTGEYLAISSDAIRRDADGFFLVLGGAPPENETRGSVVLVNVRGALQQFASQFGDSYEAIVARVGQAFASDPAPSAVVLRISSPGGVVAGLSEATAKLQRMAKEAKIPLVAYVDEMAASAAYHLACSCSEILAPPSGVCGSIGVISTQVSVVQNDEKNGVEFRIITSGKRKADGHIHVPITDDAIKAETARVGQLAAQFFGVVSKARKVPSKKIAGLEAAIYLGRDAVRVGLVDEVMSLDQALVGLGTTEVESGSTPAPNEGNETDRRARLDTKALLGTHSLAQESTMGVRLQAILKTAAAIAAEADATKRAALQASLNALVKAGGDDDDDEPPGKKDDDDDGDDDDDSKAAKAAKKAEEAKKAAKAAGHRARAAEFKKKAEEAEEEAKKAEADEEEEARHGGEEDDEAKATLALVRSITGGLDGAAARGALQAMAGTVVSVAKDVAALKATQIATAKAALFAQLKPVTTKGEREWLETQPLAAIQSFADMRTKAGFVNVSEDSLVKPKHIAPGSEASLPAETVAMIKQAVDAFPGDAKGKEAFRAQLVKNHVDALNSNTVNTALNGAPGRI